MKNSVEKGYFKRLKKKTKLLLRKYETIISEKKVSIKFVNEPSASSFCHLRDITAVFRPLFGSVLGKRALPLNFMFAINFRCGDNHSAPYNKTVIDWSDS